MSEAYCENTDKYEELSSIVSIMKRKKDTVYLIIVKVESNLHLHRTQLKDLLDDNIPVTYDDDISKVASKVCKQIAVPKRRLFKCLPLRVKSKPKKILKSLSIPDMALTLHGTGPSSDMPTTKSRKSYTIVTNLAEQTGSADGSVWV